MKTKYLMALPLITLACLGLQSTAAYAQQAASAKLSKETQAAISSSFKENGQAKLDRLAQDASNAACTVHGTSGKPMPAKLAKAIEAENLKTVKAPSDGKYLGDWKAGEKTAQDGTGLTWTDVGDKPVGGNCYNCHDIAKTSIGGSIGPSLWNYGKLRGVKDPNSAEAKAVVEYTWGKLSNARAYSACSNMPRMGHVLTEEQLKNIMALLLDPASPTNK